MSNSGPCCLAARIRSKNRGLHVYNETGSDVVLSLFRIGSKIRIILIHFGMDPEVIPVLNFGE